MDDLQTRLNWQRRQGLRDGMREKLRSIGVIGSSLPNKDQDDLIGLLRRTGENLHDKHRDLHYQDARVALDQMGDVLRNTLGSPIVVMAYSPDTAPAFRVPTDAIIKALAKDVQIISADGAILIANDGSSGVIFDYDERADDLEVTLLGDLALPPLRGAALRPR
jgi:hypothetical protein